MSILLNQVNFIYDQGTPYETKALSDVSIEINRGEFIGLIGHTGSGKSTLIQMMNGLLKPNTGEIFINGYDITTKGIKLSDVRKRVGLVFQYPEYQLFEETIVKDVAYGPSNLGLAKAEIQSRVSEALMAVGMDAEVFKDISPFEVSGGQKRRVAIAGVLAMQPEVLILDEPTAGLDPAGREDILKLIKKEHERQNRTTIFVSHSMEDVAKYVDRILVMDKGKVIFFDTPSNVFKNHEILSSIGLDIPEVTKIIKSLNENGFDLPEDVYDAHVLSRLIGEKLGGVSC
ncbi:MULTISPECIES: energy-coupling factor transporter ATPase [unclassified Fusibacter]|uniref:energy-coupling factor transporter ATPase n=1 Tax=unclassified Fusibacter TaxID=2624464 RepID=UPI001010CDAA|nr:MULTISPECIES: energy-coupling factor transporter ATPase [unclassified Fusibacter]MCK8061544.1 energy-coupling factor transporter ATPase [Fusibacter sp. A2]NPE23728.1 energy-coupling factor transporter ATPase [Fusibacter sp. A1]RXV58755.1 energy-coupling factor transporter ATPase [Fusibacter sp. A1]